MKQMNRKKRKAFSKTRIYFSAKENAVSAMITISIMILFTSISQILSFQNGELDDLSIASLFMLAILLIARWTNGYVWSIGSSIVGGILIDVLFSYPYHQINFSLPGYPIIFFCLIVTAIITSTLTVRNKQRLHESRMREQMANQIAQFSRKLMLINSYEEMTQLCVKHFSDQMETAVVFLRDINSIQYNQIVIHGTIPEYVSQNIEIMAAKECFMTRKQSGKETPITPTASFRYFPLISHGKMSGVLGILWDHPVDKEMLLRLFIMLDWTALALERQDLENQAQQIAIEAERESLRNNLLRSISHDLRTPLTGIIGATAALLDNIDSIDHKNALSLIRDINEDASWLLRMTENLLSVSKLTSTDEQVTIKKQDEAVEEIVPEAVMRCKRRMKDAVISVIIPEDPLFVPMSATLMVQVLINLIENGIRHGKSPVSVNVFQDGQFAHFSVRDYGEGLTAEVEQNLFNGVGQKKAESGRGLGIGLSLCKTIIVAHGGEITGRNHEDGGAIFEFTLPLEEDSNENE